MEEQRFTLRDFPLQTKEPTVEVALPAGMYHVELSVEDDTGQRSRATTVPLIVLAAPTLTETTQSTNAALPVDTVSGIGITYRQRLAEGGITNIGQLAHADPARVFTLMRVSVSQAEHFIIQAQILLENGP